MNQPGNPARSKTAGRAFLMLAAILWLVAAAGCGESLYDSMEPTSLVEHIGHPNATVDLYWTLHQHGFDKVVLAGCPASRLYPGRENSPSETERINKLIMTLQERNPDLIRAFPLIRLDDPDPLGAAARYLVDGRAYGVALYPQAGQDLFSQPMQRLLEACELARAPILIQSSPDRYADLERLLSDYPHAVVLAPQMAGMADDLPRLHSLLMRHNRLYLGFGFGPEDELIRTMTKLSAEMDSLRRFIEDHMERVCLATETDLTEQPYRNSAFAESQVRFLRRMLEKDRADLVLKGRDGQWIRLEFPGLALDKQKLGYLYRLNFMRALSETRPRMDAYNLDRLVPGLVRGATWDGPSDHRFIPAVVASPDLLLTGLSSTQLRKLLSGKLIDMEKIDDVGEIALVSHGPVAQWLARKLGASLNVAIRRIDDSRAFADHMARARHTIGFGAFEDLDFRMRCLTIDGESPTLSYVKYCAAKGAGTFGHYFDTYPLLIPVSSPPKEHQSRFNPHQFRRICLAGPGILGPFNPGKDRKVAIQRPTNEVAPYLRDAGITVLALGGPVTPDCGSDDCTDAAFFPGLLATGMDAFVSPDDSQNALFAPHSISRLTPDAPIVRTVRGKKMMVAGGRATPKDLPVLVKTIRQARAQGVLTAAALFASPEDFDKMARALRSAGAAAVANLAASGVAAWDRTDKGVIAPGLGAPFVPKSQESQAALLVLTFYEDRFIAAQPILVESRNGVTRRLAGRRLRDALQMVVEPQRAPGK